MHIFILLVVLFALLGIRIESDVKFYLKNQTKKRKSECKVNQVSLD